MATLLEWLQRAFASLGLNFRRESAENQWVEPGNAITRTILAGAQIEIPEVEASPLTPVTAEALDLAAFDEKPIPPLGVEPPLIQPQVAPDWEAIPQPTVAEPPRPKVAEQTPAPAERNTEEAPERKKRRWWRAA